MISLRNFGSVVFSVRGSKNIGSLGFGVGAGAGASAGAEAGAGAVGFGVNCRQLEKKAHFFQARDSSP